MTQLRYTAPPTLARMLQSNAFARVAKGPVGSGKTSACVVELLRRASQQEPDANGVRRTRFAIIRNSYRELRDTTRRTFEKWIPQQAGRWREADFAFDLKAPLGDGTKVECEILFRSLNRPEDIKKLLSLELTGAYVNELREVRKEILDVLETRIGRFPSKDEGGPTWRGWWGDTNPWAIGHAWQKFFKNPPDGYELYCQPSALGADAENRENIDDGYYERLCKGKDAEWIKVYLEGQDAASDVGSIYGALLEKYEPKIFAFPKDGIYTSYDLGFTDSTAIWFWRVNHLGGIDFVDWYENHGQPLSHYFDEVDKRGYKIAKHWLPHDAAAKTLVTGSSTEDQFREHYRGAVAIGPALSLLDGIAAGRWLLEQPCRFHAGVADGLEALRSYHYEWDDDSKTYSRKPEHDWSSHCFAGETEVLTRNGMQRIMDLPFYGEVLTPCGWRPYRNPRISKTNAQLVEVAFSDGYTVRCTPDHLFLTVNGWRSAGSLRRGSLIRSSLTRSRRFSLAVSTGSSRPAFTSAISDGFIGMCGKLLSGMRRMAATSITAMRTQAITGSRIWNASTAASISDTRRHGGWPKEHIQPSPRGRERPQPNGTEARPDAFGTSGTPSKSKHGPNGNTPTRLASFAAGLWRCWSGNKDVRSDSAATTASPLRIVAITRVTIPADVWDITVPDGQCFSLANGAVVHNSADAFRYAAIVAKYVMGLQRKAIHTEGPAATPMDRSFTLDQLWAANKQRGRERI